MSRAGTDRSKDSSADVGRCGTEWRAWIGGGAGGGVQELEQLEQYPRIGGFLKNAKKTD